LIIQSQFFPLKVQVVKGLNSARIIGFAVVLVMIHVFIGALIPSFDEFENPSASAFIFVFQYLVDAALVMALFSQLARLQRRLLYLHVACVVILYQIICITLMLVLFGQLATVSTIEFILDWTVFALSIVAGTVIGQRLRVAA
jgi:hypothetical protein